jgi:acetylornithine deacetylase/succinyl-diaminopimelate desuccinylase-like protein
MKFLGSKLDFKITLMTPSPISIDSAQIEHAKKLVDANFDAATEELAQLVRIPGIAWEAFDANNLELSAQTIAGLFEDTGVFEVVEVRRASIDGKPGSPAVVARRAARNGKPQILLYAHHDVQPPGDEAAWLTTPFEPVIKDGRMYGRGAADDKAGVVSHLSAIRTLLEVCGPDFEVGISVFIEGEEEAGSPTFRPFLEENQDILKADCIVVADSGNWSETIPALTATLRGLVSQVIEVKTLDHALHSGMYGGAVPDAMTATIRLLASLHNSDGSVAVAGLHEGQAADLPYSDSDLRRDSGLLDGVSQIGTGTILDRIWNKPAITVIGIDGQSVALSSNTMLPTVTSKISMRIAPGQKPEKALEALRAHLEANIPFGAKLTYGETELGKPFAVDDSGWASELARVALKFAWNETAVDIGVGGSIPFIADLIEVFPGAQILVTGVEDPDSRAHSPNESVHLESLRKTMLAEALMLLGGNAFSN